MHQHLFVLLKEKEEEEEEEEEKKLLLLLLLLLLLVVNTFYYCEAAINYVIKFVCERGVTITRRRSVIMKIERTKETDGTRFHEHDFTVQLTLCDHKNKTNKTNGRSKQGWR